MTTSPPPPHRPGPAPVRGPRPAGTPGGRRSPAAAGPLGLARGVLTVGVLIAGGLLALPEPTPSEAFALAFADWRSHGPFYSGAAPPPGAVPPVEVAPAPVAPTSPAPAHRGRPVGPLLADRGDDRPHPPSAPAGPRDGRNPPAAPRRTVTAPRRLASRTVGRGALKPDPEPRAAWVDPFDEADPRVARPVPPDDASDATAALASEVRALRGEVTRLARAEPPPRGDAGVDDARVLDEMNALRLELLREQLKSLLPPSADGAADGPADAASAAPPAPAAPPVLPPAPPPAAPSTAAPSTAAPSTAAGPTAASPVVPVPDGTVTLSAPPAVPAEVPGAPFADGAPGGPARFDLQIDPGTELHRVLDMLGQAADLNIVGGPDVSGPVAGANLRGVSGEEALGAVLRAHGHTYERDGRFVYVMTAAEANARAAARRFLVARVYRPHYVSSRDLLPLLAPLMTEGVGKVSANVPPERGLPLDATAAGGDSVAQRDAFVVEDYPEVLEKIDRLMAELDVPPAQVSIEAVIVRVTLSDENRYGVNLALLTGEFGLLTAGGAGAIGSALGLPGNVPGIDPLLTLPGPGFLGATGGTQYGFVRGDAAGFLESLETIGETSTLATPRVQVLNKQRAELIIGERLAFRTATFNGNQTIENVDFLDVGTKLVLRPFVAPDGLVRMEIHPEKSSGLIGEDGLPQVSTTEVTSNVMIRDGQTMVLGGLLDENLVEQVSQVPVLGSIPVVGGLFRRKREVIERSELIVLLTPRIVREAESAALGEMAAADLSTRHENFKYHLAPHSRFHLARVHYERAVDSAARCEYAAALRQVEYSLSMEPANPDALRLRDALRTRLPPDAVRTWKWWQRSGATYPGPPGTAAPAGHSRPPCAPGTVCVPE